MRVLCVSHTYVSPWQRVKLALLGSYDDTDLHVLIPPRWRGTLGLAEAAARQATPLQPVPYAMHVQPVLGAGHVRRYVFVPWRVRALLRRLRPQVVYVEAEADSLVLWQFARWRRRFDYRLVMFGWENLPRPGIRSEHSWARWMLRARARPIGALDAGAAGCGHLGQRGRSCASTRAGFCARAARSAATGR